jgi:hypothetical protein
MPSKREEISMTSEQKAIHLRAISARERFRDFEIEFIKILQDVESTKVHRAMGYPSVFVYATQELNFTESVAYMFIAVARKASELPELLNSGLSVFKSSRMVAVINRENCRELIEFAHTNSTRSIDAEMARRNPNSRRERLKLFSEESIELTVKVSKSFASKLKRVESLLAQKGKTSGIGSALEASVDEFLRKHDPVEKAKRSVARQDKMEKQNEMKSNQAESKQDRSDQHRSKRTGLCAHRVPKRIRLAADQKHSVFARDQGRCTHIGQNGRRCDSDRWLQIHHIVEVSRGGSNDPENLTTLCSFHHDLVHQLEFPLEGAAG